MSILNATWERDRCLIAVDTFALATPRLVADNARGNAAFTPAAECGEAAKMIALPSLGGVLAIRGQAALLSVLSMSALLATIGADHAAGVDLLCRDLGECIHVAQARLTADATAAGADGRVFWEVDVVVAGWSRQRGQMVVSHFYREREGDPVMVYELDDELPTIQMPWADEWGPVPSWPHAAPEMLELARKQVGQVNARGDKGFGGRLILAELSRDSACIRDLGPIQPLTPG